MAEEILKSGPGTARTGAIRSFVLPDGMVGESLPEVIGEALDGSFGTVPGTEGPGKAKLAAMTDEAGFRGSVPYVAESCDAAALILLAMQSAPSITRGSGERAGIESRTSHETRTGSFMLRGDA